MRTYVGAVGLGIAWLVLAGSASGAWCAAAILAVTCALLVASIALRQSGARNVFALRPTAFTGGAVTAVAQALADTGSVSLAIAHAAAGAQISGTTGEQRAGSAEFGETTRARRAAIVTFWSFSPSSAVIDADTGGLHLTIHNLPGEDAS
jgi:hypothetical protein